MPDFVVDKHPQKKKIIQLILSGTPVRQIAEMVVPHVPHSAVQRYKTNVIKPMLANAEESSRILNTQITHLGDTKLPVPLSSDTTAVQAVQHAIQAAPVLSIFRTRLESVHGRIERAMDRVEGNPKEFGLLPPLVNQYHKNIELLGKVTGELEQQGTTSVSIQIVCPSAPTPELTPRISYADDNATTYTASEISVTQLPPD